MIELRGGKMKQGQIWALTFSLVVFVVLSLFSFVFIQGGHIQWTPFFVGLGFLAFGVGICLPGLIPIFRGWKRAHDLKTGKIKPYQLRRNRVKRRSSFYDASYAARMDDDDFDPDSGEFE